MLQSPNSGPLVAASAGAVDAVCLAGPTASGKTALALAFARQCACRSGRPCAVEIISVDSALVYRGMDIGTAKPSAAERAAVPHHLIDVLDPTQPYSAARFATDATRLIGQIRQRGRLPLLVGGTMLYFKALREGLSAMPQADAAVRAQIDAEAAAKGWPALHAELALVDPAAAARLAPADAQRIQRALEVWRVSGRNLSSWHQGPGHPGAADAATRLPLLSLVPLSRDWLHARIAARFDAMLQAGLVAEVSGLRGRGDLKADMPAMRCVGYRQVWDALDRGEDTAGAALRERGIAATRQLAKRQLTWLRSTPAQAVVACDAAGAALQALHALRTLAGQSGDD